MEDLYNNMMAQAQTYGPNLIKAALILVAFIIVAYIAKWIVAAAINKTGLAQKANKSKNRNAKSLGASLSAAVYWIIILIGLVQSLSIAGATRISDALNGVVDPILAYLPNLIGAGIVFGIFLILAKVVKEALGAILMFANEVPKRLALADKPVDISGIAATLASGILMITGGIMALDILDIDAISIPANELLSSIMNIIPNIIAASVILAIFVVIGRFTSQMIRRILPNTGVDSAISELGLLKGADAGMTASNIIAKVTMFMIILLGLVSALNALGIDMLTHAVQEILVLGSRIVFGALIIFAGVFIARMVTNAMAATGGGATDAAANAVKWIIITLSVILGISRMGLDPTPNGSFVLDAARILLLGAAVAGAIAFGWGGRDWAAHQLEKWKSSK